MALVPRCRERRCTQPKATKEKPDIVIHTGPAPAKGGSSGCGVVDLFGARPETYGIIMNETITRVTVAAAKCKRNEKVSTMDHECE